MSSRTSRLARLLLRTAIVKRTIQPQDAPDPETFETPPALNKRLPWDNDPRLPGIPPQLYPDPNRPN